MCWRTVEQLRREPGEPSPRRAMVGTLTVPTHLASEQGGLDPCPAVPDEYADAVIGHPVSASSFEEAVVNCTRKHQIEGTQLARDGIRISCDSIELRLVGESVVGPTDVHEHFCRSARKRVCDQTLRSVGHCGLLSRHVVRSESRRSILPSIIY